MMCLALTCVTVHCCIEGSVLDAMADGMERSSVVLVCFSKKYKASINCRTGSHIIDNKSL